VEQQPKSELLIDVNDVALGHATKQKWNEPASGSGPKELIHEPLIGTEAFEQVQALQRAKGSADERSPRRTPRGYALSRHHAVRHLRAQECRAAGKQRQAALPVHVPQRVRRKE